MNTRQCYTNVYNVDTSNFSVNNETKSVELLADPQTYTYNEKTLLKEINIGQFGFGVDIMIGSNHSDFTVTNYNYMQDPYELRWKHIDEHFGQVNAAALQTYDFQYYFYTDYYTY